MIIERMYNMLLTVDDPDKILDELARKIRNIDRVISVPKLDDDRAARLRAYEAAVEKKIPINYAGQT
jgi:hypothetical protein